MVHKISRCDPRILLRRTLQRRARFHRSRRRSAPSAFLSGHEIRASSLRPLTEYGSAAEYRYPPNQVSRCAAFLRCYCKFLEFRSGPQPPSPQQGLSRRSQQAPFYASAAEKRECASSLRSSRNRQRQHELSSLDPPKSVIPAQELFETVIMFALQNAHSTSWDPLRPFRRSPQN